MLTVHFTENINPPSSRYHSNTTCTDNAHVQYLAMRYRYLSVMLGTLDFAFLITSYNVFSFVV